MTNTGRPGPATGGTAASRAVRPGPVGLAVVDKSAGWTSHDVVAKLRRVLGERRIGHAGTLDPDATGVLLVGVGRFTRVLRYLSALEKAYTGEIVLGIATTTLDASGDVTGRWDMASLGVEAVREAAQRLTGEIEQVPPMVSAVKVDGERLYKKARRGEVVGREPRRVTVYELEVLEPKEEGVFPVIVRCSTGTYIRSLAADLGSILGGGAHLRRLRRIRIGSFTVGEARGVEAISPDSLITPAQALRDLTQVAAEGEVLDLARRGRPLDSVSIGAGGGSEGPVAVLDRAGQLISVYERTDTDRLLAGVVFAA